MRTSLTLLVLAGLLALTVHLVGGLARTITEPLVLTSTFGSTTAGSANAQPAKTPEIDRRPLGAYSQILARPVFFEGRRFPKPDDKATAKPPLSPQLPPPPQPPPTTANVRIYGIHLNATERRVLLGSTPAEIAWYSEGDRFQDWIVQRIEQNQVKLSARGSVATVDLYSDQRPN